MAGKVYTRCGDSGSTSLLSGKRVPKDDPRVEVCGALDELQSHLGMAKALLDAGDFIELISEVQEDIFTASAELSREDGETEKLTKRLDETAVTKIEKTIDRYTAIYGLPKGFVVPGASLRSAALHVARTVCRRSERLIVGINREQAGYDFILKYFNRLSDLLFVLAWAQEMESIIEKAVLGVVSLGEK